MTIQKFENSIIVVKGIGEAWITRCYSRGRAWRERSVNELDYKRIKDRSFLLSLIPLELAAFFVDSWPRGNTFVAKIRPAFRPLSKDRMINHSVPVSLLTRGHTRVCHRGWESVNVENCSKSAVGDQPARTLSIRIVAARRSSC